MVLVGGAGNASDTNSLVRVETRVSDPVPEKTIGKHPWVPVGGPRGVRIVGALSKESRVNRGSGEVIVSTPSQQWFTNRRLI
jgi:hypothetical protein